jgi:hypothetical protein
MRTLRTGDSPLWTWTEKPDLFQGYANNRIPGSRRQRLLVIIAPRAFANHGTHKR